MMPVMVKEADLDRIEVPEDYEVLDATALGRRLGFKRDTVLWGPSGTKRASESGRRRRRIGHVVSRSTNSKSDIRVEG
jgi:hypothetical protein